MSGKVGENYRLVPGSVPMNAGIDLIAIVPTDFEGNLRTLPTDLGAYEYIGTNASPISLSAPQNLRVIQ